MNLSDPRRVIEGVFRDEYGRVLAALIASLDDITLAEDALGDALVMALEQWEHALPTNAPAWLTTVAKRRAIDRLRRGGKYAGKSQSIEEMEEFLAAPEDTAEDDGEIPDERLKLMFTCCHPALPPEAQIALTLQTLGGLKIEEIARAFLTSELAMAQRLSRAKTKIREAKIPYSVPPAHLLPERLDALLSTLYLIFNEGYVATSGSTLLRQDLCEEAIRLMRVLINLLPSNANIPEASGLLSLMLLSHARRAARVDEEGNIVLMEQQDRNRWNTAEISEATALLEHALSLRLPGPYQVQAAIQAIHSEAPDAPETDWRQIAALYAVLASMTGSPVVEVNRAVAVSYAEGAAIGLEILLPLENTMQQFAPYWVARGDFHARLEETSLAISAFESAIALTSNEAEKAYLGRRLGRLRIT